MYALLDLAAVLIGFLVAVWASALVILVKRFLEVHASGLL